MYSYPTLLFELKGISFFFFFCMLCPSPSNWPQKNLKEKRSSLHAEHLLTQLKYSASSSLFLLLISLSSLADITLHHVPLMKKNLSPRIPLIYTQTLKGTDHRRLQGVRNREHFKNSSQQQPAVLTNFRRFHSMTQSELFQTPEFILKQELFFFFSKVSGDVCKRSECQVGEILTWQV